MLVTLVLSQMLKATLVFGLENFTEFSAWFHKTIVPTVSSKTPDETWFGPRTWHISLASYVIEKPEEAKLKESLNAVKNFLLSNHLQPINVIDYRVYYGYLAFTWTKETETFLDNLATKCCEEFEKKLREHNIKFRREYTPEAHCTIRQINYMQLDNLKDKIKLKQEMTMMKKDDIPKAIALHIAGTFDDYADYNNRRYKAIYCTK